MDCLIRGGVSGSIPFHGLEAAGVTEPGGCPCGPASSWGCGVYTYDRSVKFAMRRIAGIFGRDPRPSGK